MTAFDEKKLDSFWKFAVERQRVWWRKTKALLPRPWTDNEILREYSFTNCYRLLDPGTQFLLREVLWADAESSVRLFNALLYRVIGRESTYARIVDAIGLVEPTENVAASLRRYLYEIQDSGNPPFSKAYTVPGYDWAPGVDKVAKLSWQAGEWSSSWEDTWELLSKSASPQEFYDVLKELRGVGNFIASQVYVDATYLTPTGKSLMGWSPEFYDGWMKAGPGALDGLWRLTGKSRTMAYVQAHDLSLIRELWEMQDEKFVIPAWDELPSSADLYPGLVLSRHEEKERLSIPDVQNLCCEFSKLDKLTEGGGKSRRKYSPRNYSPDEWTVEQFVASLARNPRVAFVPYKNGDNVDGTYVTAMLGDSGGEDITQWVARYTKVPTYDFGRKQCIFLAGLDPVKYGKNSNSDPVTEIAYHFGCGLGADIAVEFYMV